MDHVKTQEKNPFKIFQDGFEAQNSHGLRPVKPIFLRSYLCQKKGRSQLAICWSVLYNARRGDEHGGGAPPRVMTMRKLLTVSLAAVVAACCSGPAWGQSKDKSEDVVDMTTGKSKIVILPFDCPDDNEDEDIRKGEDLSDRIRMGLKKYGAEEFELIDRYTIRSAGCGARKTDTKRADIEELLTDTFYANVMVFGTLEHVKKGERERATHSWKVSVRIVDLREGSPLDEWKESFTDNTERGAGVIAAKIYEKISGKARWIPPQTGDVPEPENFGKPKNINHDFSAGGKGWNPIDNASTFIVKDPDGQRGNVLKIMNNFDRQQWRDYRRALMFGQASTAKPPKLRIDDSMGGVAGLEGTDVVSDYFAPRDGWRYWLVINGGRGEATVPAEGPPKAKVFVKGWIKTELAEDGLSETALIQMKMTPQAFAKLPPERRKALIEADRKKNPTRYVREVWRYQGGVGGTAWMRHAEIFPPRGGLMKGLDFLHIKILSYWGPGTMYFDNVAVYEDPGTTAPLDEEKARTKGDKTFTGERK